MRRIPPIPLVPFFPQTMESNFFRCLARELGPRLTGGRVQKIFHPGPGIHTFVLGGQGATQHLLLFSGRGCGHLFLSADKPDNPLEPDSRTMMLRKHLRNRRLGAHLADWPGRRMAWALPPVPEQGDRYFVLDLMAGPSLVYADKLDKAFTREPDWPDLDTVLADPVVWRTFPQISPPLRKTLALLDREAALRLMEELRQGSGPGFFVYGGAGGKEAADKDGRGECFCFELPEVLAKGRDKREFATALEAAAYAGQAAVFSAAQEQAGDMSGASRRMRRVRRGMRRMDKEAERLRERLKLRHLAEQIKVRLHESGAGTRLPVLTLPDDQGQEQEVGLDPSLTLAENMERFYREAAKAKRGLGVLAERRAGLEKELAELEGGKRTPPASQADAKKPRKKAQPKHKDLAVSRFRTSDGFLLLRGKNSAANHKLLSVAASPFDLWFHAQDGPGAHLVLKRDYPDQEVPEQSLNEAACLAGLKSWQAGSAKARVICALVKNVCKVKGAALGAVQVDVVFKALHVELEPEMEERLKVT